MKNQYNQYGAWKVMEKETGKIIFASRHKNTSEKWLNKWKGYYIEELELVFDENLSSKRTSQMVKRDKPNKKIRIINKTISEVL